MRIYAAAGALLGWFALALQLYLMLAQSPPSGVGRLGAVITFLSFFTILTNLLVAVVFTAVVFRPQTAWGEWLRSPSVQAGTAVYIAIVGIVLLGSAEEPTAAEPASGGGGPSSPAPASRAA